MVKSLTVMGTTDSDFPMSSMTGRANLLLTTSTGGGVHAGMKKLPEGSFFINDILFQPFSMEYTFFIGTLVSMRPKIIPLRLNQISGKHC
ncbi:hypothetical protein AV903_10365 [Erwinia tracheiphila]|uniref:Uncharacterized protein n=1 Tax=Erwinia tracheiphila TaxID=65700 RepID=A0A345CSE4_9GAMM|nr:hypothetical protein AV903_10365 [Erwinia tracheiphila]